MSDAAYYEDAIYYEYKVEQPALAKMSVDALQAWLNVWAEQGWRLVTTHGPYFFFERQR